MKQGDIFDDARIQPETIAGMVHRDDLHTARDAAAAIVPKLTRLHDQVLAAFRRRGRMTDEALEGLDEFATYGPSTIRKRRSELAARGDLVAVGDQRNSRGRKMLIWAIR